MPKKKTVYCSLDLEGTGLDSKKDAIIEVGAVLFTLTPYGQLEFLQEFSQLVKPPIVIPEFIQNLTNIKMADVADAPPWEAVSAKFAKFVGDHCLVGQNIQFDLAFLAAAGLQFGQAAIDTRELASIFLPEARFYNLEYLLRYLNQPLINHHRALDDSKSAAILLQQLVVRFHALPLAAQKPVVKLLKESQLVYGPLFSPLRPIAKSGKLAKAAMYEKTSASQMGLLEASGQQAALFNHSITPPAHRSPGQVLEFEGVLGRPGANFVALGLEDFSLDGLRRLAQTVVGLSQSAVLCVGTDEEFAAVASIGSQGERLILDEPKNYLCQRQLRDLLARKHRPDALTQFLVKLLIWQTVNPQARLGKLSLFGSEYIFLDLVAGSFETCGRHVEAEQCEFGEILSRASSADKIFAKQSAWLGLVEKHLPNPPHKQGIFWNLEAFEQALFRKTANILNLKGLRGLVAALYDPGNQSGVIGRLGMPAIQNFEKTLNVIDLTFGLWSIILTRELLITSQRVIDAELRETEAFGKIRAAGRELLACTQKLLESLPQPAVADLETGRLVSSLQSALGFLEEFLERPEANKIYWFDIFNERLKLKSQILAISSSRAGNFESQTLLGLVPGSIVKQYYRRIFDLHDAPTGALPSVRPALAVFTVTDLPEKESPNSQKFTTRILERLLPGLEGRTLVLFNSQKNLEHVYKTFPAAGLQDRLLIQKYTGHHWKNLENFNKLPDAVWFLTVSNFLTNIQTLPPTNNLILTRLPYDVPGVLTAAYDPDEIFEAYILPKTALRLASILHRFLGSGVIWTADARTAGRNKFIVLDPRLLLDYNLRLVAILGQLCDTTEMEFSKNDLQAVLQS